MTKPAIRNSIDYKNQKHLIIYDTLAQEYKKRAIETIRNGDLLQKAQRLKDEANGNKALEIGLGGGAMNKHLADVGFQTTGVDISPNCISNAKELNPQGEFLQGSYLDIKARTKQNLIVGLAFIHLFDEKEAKEMIKKMHSDLTEGGVVNLTTTLEEAYSYGLVNKDDYGKDFSRYRAKHTPDTFKALLDGSGLSFQELNIIDGKFGKKRMSLLARRA